MTPPHLTTQIAHIGITFPGGAGGTIDETYRRLSEAHPEEAQVKNQFYGVDVSPRELSVRESTAKRRHRRRGIRRSRG
jgi:hypothetical protein